MAVDLLSHESSSMVFSPRISFSYDLHQAEPIPIEHQRADTLLLAPNTEFDFCTSNSFEEDSSFAEELFSEGRILPIQIKKPNEHPKPPSPPPPTTTTTTTTTNNPKKESLKEIMEKSFKEEEKAPSSSSSSLTSKSFWRFKRSSSCNGNPRSLICSLPILSRSNSTPNPKKDTHKHSHKPPTSNASIKSSSSSSSSLPSFYPYSFEKAPLKKNKYGSYSNGVRISPILNVPSPYISKGTVNLFGFGYIFCNGKDKSKKK